MERGGTNHERPESRFHTKLQPRIHSKGGEEWREDGFPCSAWSEAEISPHRGSAIECACEELLRSSRFFIDDNERFGNSMQGGEQF